VRKIKLRYTATLTDCGNSRKIFPVREFSYIGNTLEKRMAGNYEASTDAKI